MTVVVDVEDYKAVLDEMAANNGATTLALRRKLAQRAFARTAAYDAAVSNWFAGELAKDGDNEPPRRRAFGGLLRQALRYGENPHQEAAFYVDGSTRPGVATAKQLQGKELSATTISTTPMPPMSWWRSSIPRPRPPAPSSSTPIPAAWRWARRLKDAYLAALACDTASAPLAACWPSTRHWTAPRRRKSPRSSPK